MARMLLLLEMLRNAHREDLLRVRRRRAKLRSVDSAFDLSDDEFLSRYRLDRSAFETLRNDIEPLLNAPRRVGGTTRCMKILAALDFYASGGYQQRVGNNGHMSQSSASIAVRAVTDALNSPGILAKYIRFPQNRHERNEIKQRFFQKYKMPGVIGCIDCTHVPIIRPRRHQARYFNRKYYNSLNVQVICDDNLNIMSVDPSYGGATHDSSVWNNHPVKRHLEQLTASGDPGWLLGDSGYAQREYMMTPVLNSRPGTVEEYYDSVQSTARKTVQGTFAALKGRWRCLLVAQELHYDPTTAARIVNACCVLHNLCNGARLEFQGLNRRELLDDQRLQEYSEPGDPRLPDGAANEEELRRGSEARAKLAGFLWENRI